MFTVLRQKWREFDRKRRLAKLDPRVFAIEEEHLAFRAFVFNNVTDLPELALTPIVYAQESNLEELRRIVSSYEGKIGYSPSDSEVTLSDGAYGDVAMTLFADLEELRNTVFFLSYCHVDHDHIDNFFELLNIAMAKFRAFVDTQFFLDPIHWKTFVNEAIGKGTIFVVFWTRQSQVSEAVSYEFDLAAARGAIVVVVCVDGCHFPMLDDAHFLVNLKLPYRTTDVDTVEKDYGYTPIAIAEELALLCLTLKFIAHFPRDLRKDLWDLIVLTNRLRPLPLTLIPRMESV